MNVHNILEEEVIKSVNSMYDQMQKMKTPWLTCDCEQCRLDVTSYVLNRLPPKYVVSGRGVIYNTSVTDFQQKIDIETLVMEAIRIVSSVQRPYHNQKKQQNQDALELSPAFNFPTFLGAVFDGNTFEPLKDAEVFLKHDNDNAEMMDYTWNNPCITDKRTKCSYTFWVKPQLTKNENESKVFKFSIIVKKAGYEDATYSFDVPLVSQQKPLYALNATYSLKIQDLFLFPAESE